MTAAALLLERYNGHQPLSDEILKRCPVCGTPAAGPVRYYCSTARLWFVPDAISYATTESGQRWGYVKCLLCDTSARTGAAYDARYPQVHSYLLNECRNPLCNKCIPDVQEKAVGGQER